MNIKRPSKIFLITNKTIYKSKILIICQLINYLIKKMITKLLKSSNLIPVIINLNID